MKDTLSELEALRQIEEMLNIVHPETKEDPKVIAVVCEFEDDIPSDAEPVTWEDTLESLQLEKSPVRWYSRIWRWITSKF